MAALGTPGSDSFMYGMTAVIFSSSGHVKVFQLPFSY